MSNKKIPSVKLNYLYNLSYQLLAVILPLITTPYISRVLKTEGVGAYSYTYSIATYFSLFGILGLNMYGQLKISKIRNDINRLSEEFWGIFISKMITSLISIFVYMFVIINAKEYKIIFLAMIIVLIANIFDISWLFQGLEQFKKIVLRNYLIKLLSLILIFLFVKDKNDIVLYTIILHGSTLLGNLTLWLSLKKYLVKVDFKDVNIINHIKSSLPYFLPTIASSVYTVLDKSMLGWIIGSDYENGVYEQAHKIELTAVMIISSLSTVILPRMSYLHSENKIEEYNKIFQNTLRYVGAMAIPMTFGLIGVADTFVPIFLGEGYGKCIILLRIFSFLVILSGINTIIGNQCLVARGKQSKYNTGVILGALANLMLNLILIPHMKSVGAAIASVLAEVVIFIIFIKYCKENITFIKLTKIWTKYIISAVIMAFAVWCIGMLFNVSLITLIIQIVSGVIIYLVLLFLLKDELIKDFNKSNQGRILP